MNLTIEELKSPPALLVRYGEWVGAGYGGTAAPEAIRLRFFGAAEHAIDPTTAKGKIMNPQGLFRDVVIGEKWHKITNSQEGRAASKLKELDRQDRGFA